LEFKAFLHLRDHRLKIPEMNAFPFTSIDQYRKWRQQKLSSRLASRTVHVIDDPSHISPGQIGRIAEQVAQCGFALYRLPADFTASRHWLIAFGERFGLRRLDSNLCSDPDSISTLQDSGDHQRKRGYIPYTNRPLNWHTDGYYNPPEQQIGAFILHCAQDAASGGENGLMDAERVWLQMYDENPAWVEALSHPEAMSIPPNVEAGEEIHGWIRGPVFSLRPSGEGIHMRYTARQRNIRWRDDATTLEALTFLQNLLQSEENGVVWHRLAPGEGVISNNALHCRKGFKNGPGQERLYYRARYFDSVTIKRT
jgi:hypothetical protein